jgi:hypothetical protein
MNHTYNTLTAVMATFIIILAVSRMLDAVGWIYIAFLIAGTALLTIALRNTTGE